MYGIFANIWASLLVNAGKYIWSMGVTCCNNTGKTLSLPAPTPTICPNIKKHCVLWDKMHMSMIMAFILRRTA